MSASRSAKVTPEMIRVGVAALEAWTGACHDEMIVERVYIAMAGEGAARKQFRQSRALPKSRKSATRADPQSTSGRRSSGSKS